jgi:hypothetical protein
MIMGKKILYILGISGIGQMELFGPSRPAAARGKVNERFEGLCLAGKYKNARQIWQRNKPYRSVR